MFSRRRFSFSSTIVYRNAGMLRHRPSGNMTIPRALISFPAPSRIYGLKGMNCWPAITYVSLKIERMYA